MSLIIREPTLLNPITPLLDDRVFSDMLWPSLLSGGRMSDVMTLRLDVVENDDSYCVTTDLPGVEKNDIEVSIADGVLTIKAKAESGSKEEKDGQLIRQERYSGQYLRSFDLGNNVLGEDVNAHFENGVLTITVKKVEAHTSEPLKIEVK